ncbi:MAG TPA: Lrp/AsnC family transcriptional regulator [Terriglobales bacterium]|nr:Lrp/AsnC family transcriptional regulator [Terriglobales bacterium]
MKAKNEGIGGRTPSIRKTALDPTDWRILEELQRDARLSAAELGRRVHLSAPAVAARVGRLEDAGVITGYRADISLDAIGLEVLAFVRVRSSRATHRPFLDAVADRREVLECHHVTGEDCFVVKVAAGSIARLEEVVAELAAFGATTTSIVFSTAVGRRTMTADGTGKIT